MIENQVYRKLLILRDSMKLEERKKARSEILAFGRNLLNLELSAIIESETDSRILAYVVDLILEVDPEHAASRLESLLSFPDGKLRRHICGMLSNCSDKLLAKALLENQLQRDDDANVRVAAAFALGQIGDEESLPFLLDARNNDFAQDFENISVSEEAGRAIDCIQQRLKSNDK